MAISTWHKPSPERSDIAFNGSGMPAATSRRYVADQMTVSPSLSYRSEAHDGIVAAWRLLRVIVQLPGAIELSDN